MCYLCLLHTQLGTTTRDISGQTMQRGVTKDNSGQQPKRRVANKKIEYRNHIRERKITALQVSKTPSIPESAESVLASWPCFPDAMPPSALKMTFERDIPGAGEIDMRLSTNTRSKSLAFPEPTSTPAKLVFFCAIPC